MHALASAPGSLSPLLLSIAGRVGHAFEIRTMIAGFACHARGVAIEAESGKTARAIVKSKRAHTVDFRVESGKLLVKCSCPAESMGVSACKHTWAALLEIDKQGGLAELRTKRGPLVLERELSPEPEPEPPPARLAKKKAVPVKASVKAAAKATATKATAVKATAAKKKARR